MSSINMLFSGKLNKNRFYSFISCDAHKKAHRWSVAPESIIQLSLNELILLMEKIT